MRTFLRRLMARARHLWERAKREHSTPPEVAWSVAVGVFSGCTPFLGLHMWIALALATVMRLNRLWALVGSRVASNVIFAWIAFCEIELAHRLRTGAWVPLAPREAIAHGRQLLVDWLIGAVFVGAALAAVIGVLAYLLARRWENVRPPPRTPPAPRPPSSESPPTAPPAPTS